MLCVAQVAVCIVNIAEVLDILHFFLSKIPSIRKYTKKEPLIALCEWDSTYDIECVLLYFFKPKAFVDRLHLSGRRASVEKLLYFFLAHLFFLSAQNLSSQFTFLHGSECKG